MKPITPCASTDDHISEAKRLIELSDSDLQNMGRIERTMFLVEANNHLLWAILGEGSLDKTDDPR